METSKVKQRRLICCKKAMLQPSKIGVFHAPYGELHVEVVCIFAFVIFLLFFFAHCISSFSSIISRSVRSRRTNGSGFGDRAVTLFGTWRVANINIVTTISRGGGRCRGFYTWILIWRKTTVIDHSTNKKHKLQTYYRTLMYIRELKNSTVNHL